VNGKQSRRRREASDGGPLDPPGLYEYDMPDGRLGWEICWPGADGKTKWKRLGAMPKTEALDIQRERRVAARLARQTGTALPDGHPAPAVPAAVDAPAPSVIVGRPVCGLAMFELVQRWREDAASRCRRKTMDRYDAFVKHRVGSLAERLVEDLTEDVVSQWYEALVAATTCGKGQAPRPLALSSVYTYARTLLTVLRWGHEQTLVPAAIFKDVSDPLVKLTAPAGRRMAFDDQELKAMLAACDENAQARALLLVGGFCGLRLGEILGLTWKRVSFKTGKLLIREQLETRRGEARLVELKTQWSPRNVLLPERVAAALSALCDRRPTDGLVFCHADGTALRHEYARLELFYPAVERSGITAEFCARGESENMQEETPVFHHLRHTYASLSIARGVPPAVLAKQLGHRNSAVTVAFYAHFYDQHQHLPAFRQVLDAEIEKIDDVSSLPALAA